MLYGSNHGVSLGSGFREFRAANQGQPQYRELISFKEFSEKKIWKDYHFSGLFSPKFFEKMGISHDVFFNFISKNLDADILLFHPYPRELSIANNFLELAEHEHPGIIKGLTKIWGAILNSRMPVVDATLDRHLCCHCNYFLGSRLFWSKYSIFIDKFFKFMEVEDNNWMHGPVTYTLSKSIEDELPLVVFIFERMLSIFLKHMENAFEVRNFSYLCNWSPTELFSGENALITRLLADIALSNDLDLFSAKSLAVEEYFLIRRKYLKS